MSDKDKTIEGSKKPVLLEGADYYGVELGEKDNVATIKEKIKADGITDEDWETFLNLKEQVQEKADEKAKEKEENGGKDEDVLLIKMNRRNPSMTIKGHKFTQRHPYQLVPVKDAEFIVQTFKGFSVALPSEVEEYYK